MAPRSPVKGGGQPHSGKKVKGREVVLISPTPRRLRGGGGGGGGGGGVCTGGLRKVGRETGGGFRVTAKEDAVPWGLPGRSSVRGRYKKKKSGKPWLCDIAPAGISCRFPGPQRPENSKRESGPLRCERVGECFGIGRWECLAGCWRWVRVQRAKPEDNRPQYQKNRKVATQDFRRTSPQRGSRKKRPKKDRLALQKGFKKKGTPRSSWTGGVPA